MRKEVWAFYILCYLFLLSFIRHSMWLGINSFTLGFSLLENLILILTLIPAVIVYKSTTVRWSGVLITLWLVYATFVGIMRILSLTILLGY